jgi:menaquinone-specific isochorismate synthase
MCIRDRIVNILGGEKNPENYLNDLNDLLNQKFENANGGNNFHKTVRLYIDDTRHWNEMIYSCLQKISKKDLEKVVTARSVTIEINSEINLKEIIDSLEDNYPACYTFLYKNGGSAFFGATPEKLFKLDKENIETDALAGSIQRGDSPASDNELGLQLLESEKDINEHNSVRNFLLEKLYNVTNDIKFDSTPRLRKLNNIQHLWTPITAKLKNDIDVLTLIENIFPTPAICGYPTETAMKLIGSLENFDRGLYAGIIGWFNLDNEGEFAVALRSALLKDNLLHAFAGCGIVEGSNPISEYNETELKLKPILSLFVDETINQS